MSPWRILCVFGTRPDAIKMAPVVRALKAAADFEGRVAVTAQHREILDQVLEHFSILPDHDLDVMRARQSLTDIAVNALPGLEQVYRRERPDMVLVQGDTATTFLGALSAFWCKIPVGHVEAGLRTGHRYLPFPEEMNRRLTTTLASLHFAPTRTARNHLVREGVDPHSIVVTGNTAVDALRWTVREGPPLEGRYEARLDPKRPLVLVEAHRRENWGPPMDQIFTAVARLAHVVPTASIWVSVHPNPEVSEPARRILTGVPGVELLTPPDYGQWARLLHRAALLVTDSGGAQEEAPSLGVPVLLLRESTERPEAIEAGVVTLVGVDPEVIVSNAERILGLGVDGRPHPESNPFGDGRAAERILQAIRHFFDPSIPAPEPLVR